MEYRVTGIDLTVRTGDCFAVKFYGHATAELTTPTFDRKHALELYAELGAALSLYTQEMISPVIDV